METRRKPMGRWESVIVPALLCLGIALRILGLGFFPPGLNQDEASTGCDAWALLVSGMDRNGDAWPVLFTSWGSGQNALYAYLLLPLMALLGRSAAVLRLPAALLGSLSLFLFWRMGRRHGGPVMGICALGLLAVNPWHLLISRWALESNLLPVCLLLGAYLLDLALEDRPWCLLPAAGALALGLYAYGTAFLFLPLFLLPCCLLLLRRRFPLLPFLASLGLFILIAFPIFLCNLRNQLGMESMKLLCFTLPRLTQTRQTATMSFSGQNLLNALRLLWKQSDGLPWNSAGPFGLLWGLPGLALALGGLGCSLCRIARRRGEDTDYIALFALAAGLISCLFINVNVNRVNFLFLPLVWFQASGLLALVKALPGLRIPVCILLLFALGLLCRYCLTQQRAALEPAFHTGLLEAVSSLEEGTETVWITNRVNMPYVYVLFARGIPPEEFRKDVVYADPAAPFRQVTRFGRWRFGSALPDEGLCILPLTEARGYEEKGYLRIRAVFGLYAVAEAGNF